jgi:hypothetical protein
MLARERIVFCCLALLALTAGVLLLSEETQAQVVDDTEPSAPAALEAAEAPSAPVAAEPAAVAVPRPEQARDTRAETVGWTKGIVRGDIVPALSVISRLTTLTVVVEEARSMFAQGGQFTRPVRIQMPVERAVGTTTFEVRDVPFSEYPYVVTVLAPGLNGSRSVITVDADHALVDHVQLRITPGAPFTLLVRDQDASPYPGLDVRMLPVGEPLGRPMHGGKTNNFGSVVFDSVLAGDYQVTYSLDGQPVTETQTVTVSEGANTVVQGQSHATTIARGLPVQVQVHDRSGYAILDAKVTATAKDRIKLTAPELSTNGIGRVTFAHLQPGEWQLTIEKQGFERRDLPLVLQPGVEPSLIDVTLVPTR